MGDTTKYQANFKTPGAGQYGKTLINVYADTAAEFSTQLEALLGDGDGPGLVSLILDVEKLVDAGSVVATTPASQPAAPQQQYQQSAQQYQPQATSAPLPPGPAPITYSGPTAPATTCSTRP